MHIQTDRLILKEIEEHDIESIHLMNSCEEVEQFNTIGIPTNIKQTEALLRPIIDDKNQEARTLYGWSLRTKSVNEFVGEFGMRLSSKKYNKAEIHFSLMPTHWGNGFGTEAAKAIIDFGFKALKLHRIEAGVAVKNKASIKLLEKIGMKREGKHRQILPIRGEWVDNYSYAILEEDWASI